MRIYLAVLLVLSSIVFAGFRVYEKKNFHRNVTGYLARAGDASSVQIAKQELDIALDYLEANNITSGYTSILYTTPDEDIGFWYNNLKASSEALGEATNAPSLEKSNLLLKLRETIYHRGGEGKERVTYPEAVYLYPHNVAWGWGTWGAALAFVVGMLLFIPPEEWTKGSEKAEE